MLSILYVILVLLLMTYFTDFLESQLQRHIFTDYADVMGHEEAADCVTFGVKEMKFDWTINDDSLNCGIYMAYFMEQYQGTINIDPLFKFCLLVL